MHKQTVKELISELKCLPPDSVVERNPVIVPNKERKFPFRPNPNVKYDNSGKPVYPTPVPGEDIVYRGGEMREDGTFEPMSFDITYKFRDKVLDYWLEMIVYKEYMKTRW